MRRYIRLLAILLAFALVAAACGDDDTSTAPEEAPAEEAPAEEAPAEEAPAEEAPAEEAPAEEAPAEEAPADDPAAEGLARAQAVVDAVAEPPADIGPTVALDAVPEEGKTVAWLACEVTCAAFNPAFEEATAALGWNLEIINVASFGNNAAVLQALDLGADYIAITGTPPALIAEEIETAKQAGVGFYYCFDTTEPDPDVNNIFMQCANDENVFNAGNLHANKVIVESGGTANVLMVNIPDFAVLVSEREGAAAAYAENCPGCTFNELAVTLDQLLAGEVPGAIVSALQADPDIDWLHIAFDGMSGGILDTLDEAALSDRVKVTGVDLDTSVLPDIINGRYEFWTVNPVLYAAWLMVDGMARTSVGMEVPVEDRSTVPTFIVDTPEQAQELLDSPAQDWKGPATMEDQFKALWGVG